MADIPLLIVGAGGHARSCIDVVEATGRFRIVGLVEAPLHAAGDTLGFPLLGDDENLPALVTQYRHALVGIGQIGEPGPRRRIFDLLRSLGAILPAIVSPHAVVSRYTHLAEGVLVGHGAIVHAGADIGENVILNSRALIEHDVTVGAHCHVATGAIVNGGTIVEEGCFIGSGAILREGIRVGRGSFIGAGSLVKRDCAPGGIIKRTA